MDSSERGIRLKRSLGTTTRVTSDSAMPSSVLLVLEEVVRARRHALADADQRARVLIETPHAANDGGRDCLPLPRPCVYLVDTKPIQRALTHIYIVRHEHDSIDGVKG